MFNDLLVCKLFFADGAKRYCQVFFQKNKGNTGKGA